jgi:hypothetical protein
VQETVVLGQPFVQLYAFVHSQIPGEIAPQEMLNIILNAIAGALRHQYDMVEIGSPGG